MIHSLIYLLNKHEKSAYSVLGNGDVTVNKKDKETPLRYFDFSCWQEPISRKCSLMRGRYSMSKYMCCFREDAWGSAHGLETFDQWPACGKERSTEVPRSMWSIWCFLTLYLICKTEENGWADMFYGDFSKLLCGTLTMPGWWSGDQDRLLRTGSLSPCRN